ncbi:MAG: hypothetical protein JNJ47_02180 [Alphaproteobacteria bacterium]|nr:hypothetical protein [Alphaproteobacteria bacterium]
MSEKRALFFSHAPSALGKEISPHSKNAKEYYITAEFKKEMLGEAFYQKITTRSASHKAPQMVSEELKREMLGDKFYNRSYKKAQTSHTKEIEKLSRMHILSNIEEDHVHHKQEISISQKPPSRGRRR